MQSELDPVRNQRTLGLSIKIKIEREGWRSWDLGRQVGDFWSEYLQASASVGWYDNWFWYLISPPQMSGDTFLLWVCCQIELAASWLVCTFQRFSLDWCAEPYRHLPTVQCYHSNCNIIEDHPTHAILNASLRCTMTAFARVEAQVWLLMVTNNSLELTLTYEGLRVWPGQ